MFDTYITRKGDHGTTIVHEHRAPTDESVRLLREMEAKAEERVLAAYRCKTPAGFDATVIHQRDFSSVGGKWTLRYRLHGEARERVIEIEPWLGLGTAPDQEWLDGLLAAVSRDLASVICRVALTGRLK